MLAAYINALFPVVFCSGLGFFLSKKTGLLDSSVLSRLVTLIGLPALILTALFGMDTPVWTVSDTLKAIFAVLVVSALVGALVLKLAGLSVRGYLSMLVNPNTGNLGIPLVFSLLGEQALIHAVVISTVTQLSHFTLGVWLLSGRLSFKSVFSNASIIALIVGLTWMSTGWKTPVAIIRTVELLAGMTLPVMLLLLGQSLSTVNLREFHRLKVVFGLSIGRVLLGLGSALAVVSVLPLPSIAAQTLVIQASMPAAVISYILASHYNGPNDDIAAVILFSMPVSLVVVLIILNTFV